MNTPTHMLIGAVLFARRGKTRVNLAALAGGLLPDVGLFVLVWWSARIAGIDGHTVFSTLFFSESWQSVFAVDHSFFVWGGLLAIAQLRGLDVLRTFAGGGSAHAAVDFLTHNEDARRQFWPVSDWVLRSPVSYWDPSRYGGIVAPVEAGMVILMTALLLYRLRRGWERALVLAIAAILIVPIAITGGFHGLHGMG